MPEPWRSTEVQDWVLCGDLPWTLLDLPWIFHGFQGMLGSSNCFTSGCRIGCRSVFPWTTSEPAGRSGHSVPTGRAGSCSAQWSGLHRISELHHPNVPRVVDCLEEMLCPWDSGRKWFWQHSFAGGDVSSPYEVHESISEKSQVLTRIFFWLWLVSAFPMSFFDILKTRQITRS